MDLKMTVYSNKIPGSMKKSLYDPMQVLVKELESWLIFITIPVSIINT